MVPGGTVMGKLKVEVIPVVPGVTGPEPIDTPLRRAVTVPPAVQMVNTF